MKTWTKTDLCGVVFILFGVIFLIFSDSQILTISTMLISSVSLLYGLYESKYDSAKYRDLLCHYQAILSANSDGWIAWNQNHEYINSSKKFKECFDFQGNSDIFFKDIVSTLQQDDAENLSFAFNRLKKNGLPFEAEVSTLNNKNIKIFGSKMFIGGLETVTLWCQNTTETFHLVNDIENDLVSAQEEINSLREMLDAIPIQVWKRNNRLEIIYCNKAYANSLSVSPEKVILNNLPLIPGAIFGQGHSLAETVKKSKKPQRISQFAVIDGVRKKLSINELPAANDEFIGFALDITKMENLSSNIDKIVTANHEVLENLSTAIAIFGEDTRLSFFNSTYQRLMKLEASWLHSKPTYGEILEERRNNRQIPEHADFQVFKKEQLALFTSITSPLQELLHLPSGKSLRVVIAPYPLGGLIFVYEDVTDSLVLQRKNNTLLAVQKETLDHLYEGIMVFGSDNRLKIVNQAFLKIWNINDTSAEKLKGCHLSEVMDMMKTGLDYGDDWEVFRANAISNFTDRINKTGQLTKIDNSIILFTYTPLPDGAHMHSFMDITDTYKVEQAIMEKNELLKTSQTLRFELVSGISIELREPLNSVIGFAELLLNQYFGSLNQKQLEYCKYILSSSNQLNELIGNLMEMVSIDLEEEKLNISTFPLKETLEEVVNSISKRAQEKNIDIIRVYEKDNLIYNGDRIRIKQAIFNVLINAIQFSSPNGKVNMRLTMDTQNVKIIITDNGEKYRDPSPSRKVFQRSNSKSVNFINSDANNISMPLVRSLLEMHGGSLHTAFNDVERCTSVICSLPLSNVSFKDSRNEKQFLENLDQAI